jgi:hypothetical protein
MSALFPRTHSYDRREAYLKEQIAISLTSFPDRIDYVYKTINSLINQSVKTEKILLYLSKCEFENKGKKLPKALTELVGINGFEIKWVEDNLKSHKKYYYVFQEYRDWIIITVDDDFYYDKEMLADLLVSYRKHSKAISARNVHLILKEKGKIADYQKWENSTRFYEGQERMDLCAIGCGGILYPPACASDEWFDESKMIYFQNQDDLWLKYNEIIKGIPTVWAKPRESDAIIKPAQEVALYKYNALVGNDKCIIKMSELLQKECIDIWDKYIDMLEEVSDFLQRKKKYYQDLLSSFSSKTIYICGAGQYADILYTFLENIKKTDCIKAFLVIKEQEYDKYHGKEVKYINTMDLNEEFYVICGVGKKYEKEFRHALGYYPFCHWIDVDIGDLKNIL